MIVAILLAYLDKIGGPRCFVWVWGVPGQVMVPDPRGGTARSLVDIHDINVTELRSRLAEGHPEGVALTAA
jgi:hypothetical protein